MLVGSPIDRCLIVRPVEDAAAMNALILGARAVHTVQHVIAPLSVGLERHNPRTPKETTVAEKVKSLVGGPGDDSSAELIGRMTFDPRVVA